MQDEYPCALIILVEVWYATKNEAIPRRDYDAAGRPVCVAVDQHTPDGRGCDTRTYVDAYCHAYLHTDTDESRST